MGKEAYYFSHDDNARNDIKIRAMRKRYGMAGYGRWWVLIELLRSEQEHQLPHKEFTYIALADEFDCDAEEAKKYVRDLIETFELLQSNETHFWSESLNRRMDKRQEAIEQRRKAGKASAAKRAKSTTNSNERSTAVQRYSTSVEQLKERKGKERKEKESRRARSVDDDEIYPLKVKKSSEKTWQEISAAANSIASEEISAPPKLEVVRDEDLSVVEVAQLMADYYETDEGKLQWEMMCRSQKINPEKIEPISVTMIFAGKNQDKPFILNNWQNHTAKLTNWIANHYRAQIRSASSGNKKNKPTALKKIPHEKYAKYEAQFRAEQAEQRAASA